MYIIWTSLVWWNFNNSLRKKLASVEKRIVLGATNCRNFSAHAAVHVSKSYFTQCHLFFRTFWRNSVFWLLFVFSLFCCRSFFVVTCIVNWLMTGFFLWFCSKIVHRRALLVIIAPHVKCTYVHAFPALDLYLLQRFLWIKLNHNNNKLLIRTRKKNSVSVYLRVVFEKITCHWVLIFYLSDWKMH